MKLLNILLFPWDRFDRYLCRSLPGPIRYRWAKLWVRKDESHPSLKADVGYVYSLNAKKRRRYFKNLMSRQEKAHLRDIARTQSN